MDSEEAIAANTRIPRDTRTRLLSSESYSNYGSVNDDDDDAEDFSVRREEGCSSDLDIRDRGLFIASI